MGYFADPAEAQDAFDRKPAGSPDVDARIQQQIRQMAADEMQRDVGMLTEEGQALAAEDDSLAEETFAIADGFEAVTRVARRPDVDPHEVLAAFDELDRRARALGLRVDGWSARATQHRDNTAVPGRRLGALRRKWASAAPSERERFLIHIEGL